MIDILELLAVMSPCNIEFALESTFTISGMPHLPQVQGLVCAQFDT